jgi:hypothetical protein
MKLVQALRADPLLLALTALLVLAGWAPLFVTPFLPLSDLHNNAAAAVMLPGAAWGSGTLGYYYQVNWAPIPYWTAYAIMIVAGAVGGVLFAAKAMVAVLVVALPLSLMRLLLAVGRSPRLGLWWFAAFWEHNLYSGWVTYLLGMALALYALAELIEMESWRDAWRVLGWTVLVGLGHIQAVALLAVAGLGITVIGRMRGKSVAQHALALSGGALPVLPWVGAHLLPNGHGPRQPFWFDWTPLSERASKLFSYTFDDYPKDPPVWAPAFAFAVMLLGPLVLAAVRQRPALTSPGSPDRSLARDGSAPAVVVVLSCVLLYGTLPFEIRGPVEHYHNYPRFATFVLLTLPLLPRPDLRRFRALYLAPGIVAALAMDATTLAQFRRFGAHARPFLELFPHVPAGSRILPLIHVNSDPACAYDPYNQFHAYLSAATSSYDPYLFHNDGMPLLYRTEHEPKIPRWRNVTDQLDMEKHAGSFDFILVQGLDRDPFRPGGRLAGARVRRVAEAGIWRLYAIARGEGRAGAAARP